MKKLFQVSLIFLFVGVLIGVYYRELTRMTGYQGGITLLSFGHGHTILLGFVLPVLIAFMKQHLGQDFRFSRAWCTYFTGVIMTVFMLLLRGTFVVLGTALSNGADKAISGVSGLSHIVFGVSLFIIVYSSFFKKEKTK